MLVPDKVEETSQPDITHMVGMTVCMPVPRSEQKTTGGKLIRTRWSTQTRQTRHNQTTAPGWWVWSTTLVPAAVCMHRPHPLEAPRFILSDAATHDSTSNSGDMYVMINDVKGA